MANEQQLLDFFLFKTLAEKSQSDDLVKASALSERKAVWRTYWEVHFACHWQIQRLKFGHEVDEESSRKKAQEAFVAFVNCWEAIPNGADKSAAIRCFRLAKSLLETSFWLAVSKETERALEMAKLAEQECHKGFLQIEMAFLENPSKP